MPPTIPYSVYSVSATFIRKNAALLFPEIEQVAPFPKMFKLEIRHCVNGGESPVPEPPQPEMPGTHGTLQGNKRVVMLVP